MLFRSRIEIFSTRFGLVSIINEAKHCDSKFRSLGILTQGNICDSGLDMHESTYTFSYYIYIYIHISQREIKKNCKILAGVSELNVVLSFLYRKRENGGRTDR